MKENDLDENNYKENENSGKNEVYSKTKEIRKKMNNLMERYGLNVDLRKESWNSFYKKTGKILPDLLNNENDKKILLDYASYIDENFEDILINPIDFDINFYKELKEKIELAFNKNSDTTNKILIDIHWKLTEKYNYNNIIQSILIYRDLEEEIGSLVKNLPLRGHSEDYDKISKKINEIIEKSEEKNFNMYFFDYILKFGYLIEAYIKEIFILYLKLCSIIDNTKKPNYDDIITQESGNRLTIGKVFDYLDNYDSGTDKEISKLRNSIFHTSFLIDYQVKFEERKIIFNDRGRVIEKSIEDLILLVDYCIKIIHSFYLAFLNFMGVRSLFEYISNQTSEDNSSTI